VCHGESVNGVLKNPPLREAVFELFTDPDAVTQWSTDTAARVFARLPEYAHHEEQVHELRLVIGPDGPSKQSAVVQRIRRWDEQKNRAVQFGPNMCAFNILGSGYTRFEDHLATLTDVIRGYFDEMTPPKIAWVGQRYINAVKIADLDVASYFTIYPKLPAALSNHPPFALQVQLSETKNSTVVVNLGLERADGADAIYTLDIYARSAGGPPVDVDDLIRWHITTHDLVRDAFRLTTSERLRQKFDGEP